MEVRIDAGLFEQLKKCPVSFQNEFRKVYQLLKAADKPTEIKGILYLRKNCYKITIRNSRIILKIDEKKALIGLFLYNEFF